MKIGDLVKVKAKFCDGEEDEFGIVLVPPDEFGDVVSLWSNGDVVWIDKDYLEIANENR